MKVMVYNTYESVLEAVRTWPPSKRFLLIQDVMKTLEPTFHLAHSHKEQTVDQALGLLITNQPHPSDAEVQQWLEECRMEKYG